MQLSPCYAVNNNDQPINELGFVVEFESHIISAHAIMT